MLLRHFFLVTAFVYSATIFCVVAKSVFSFDEEKMEFYRKKARDIFFHAYENYVNFAYPLDELKPISCQGMDTWGSFSLSLVDSLDMLIVMGKHCEFRRAVSVLLQQFNVSADVNVSVFETNIRVIGGLVSAHLLSRSAGAEFQSGWPCDGPILQLAEKLAQRLLPAFDTVTGMPYGTVNLLHGVCKNETPITCTASIGTFLLEFGTLSRLTGNPVYENVALKALKEIWEHRSNIGLVGNHINIQTADWTATDSGIGGGVDSYFEYLVKGSALFGQRSLMKQFDEYRKVIDKYVRHNDWFPWVSMYSGSLSLPIFQSLEAFWPGLLTLVGDIEAAHKILLNYNVILNQYGMTPEFYNLHKMEPYDNRMGYPLRPELAESLMYMYRATEDEQLLRMGASMIEAIERGSKTNCGFATVYNVLDHSIEDRMESFFLAETTKYLYLLFDPENPLHKIDSPKFVVDGPKGKCLINQGGQIFNTEAHPVDASINDCCQPTADQDLTTADLDLTTLIPVSDHQWLDQLIVGGTVKKVYRRKCRVDMYPMPSVEEHNELDVIRLNRRFPKFNLNRRDIEAIWRSRLSIRRIEKRVDFVIIKSCIDATVDDGHEDVSVCPPMRLDNFSQMLTCPASESFDLLANGYCQSRSLDSVSIFGLQQCDKSEELQEDVTFPQLSRPATTREKKDPSTANNGHSWHFFSKLHPLQCSWLSQVVDVNGDLLYPEISRLQLCSTLQESDEFMDYTLMPTSFADFCSSGPFLRRFSVAGETMQ